MNPLLERIVIDPNRCFGKPTIRGTRIWTSLLLDFLANGMTPEEILAEYPHLELEDIQAAIAYGAEMSRKWYVEKGREKEAFQQLHATSLEKYAREYVAICSGKLVDHDTDQAALFARIEKQYPNQFVLIRPVRQEPEIVYKSRSLHL